MIPETFTIPMVNIEGEKIQEEIRFFASLYHFWIKLSKHVLDRREPWDLAVSALDLDAWCNKLRRRPFNEVEAEVQSVHDTLVPKLADAAKEAAVLPLYVSFEEWRNHPIDTPKYSGYRLLSGSGLIILIRDGRLFTAYFRPLPKGNLRLTAESALLSAWLYIKRICRLREQAASALHVPYEGWLGRYRYMSMENWRRCPIPARLVARPAQTPTQEQIENLRAHFRRVSRDMT